MVEQGYKKLKTAAPRGSNKKICSQKNKKNKAVTFQDSEEDSSGADLAPNTKFYKVHSMCNFNTYEYTTLKGLIKQTGNKQKFQKKKKKYTQQKERSNRL